MVRIVPAGHVSTDEALAELVQRDAEWQRLDVECREATERHWTLTANAAATARGNRAAQLTDQLRSAIEARVLVALAVDCSTAGGWELPSSYWADEVAATVALHRGAVAGSDGPHEGRALCFVRSEWTRWLTPAAVQAKSPPAAPAMTPPAASAQDQAEAQSPAEAPSAVRRPHAAKASQAEHRREYEKYRDRCVAEGRSPNVNEDEPAGRDALGVRFDRDRWRDARRRLKPDGWSSTGKRKAQTTV